jgi:transposase
MLLTHKIELRPTKAQLTYFSKCAGTMRFVYNKLNVITLWIEI